LQGLAEPDTVSACYRTVAHESSFVVHPTIRTRPFIR
jgi:hypothetical protein